ncbi:hypothetical protein M9H77_36842 [Catharanthus roseus]|uniref:Uncharacterized protein n=1 Tax=Catharanthus roseus TaxID=4058 RepID=A0ACB9ZX78_CATRO|nr:hypothetical protein M9H77_36842 [Catharanthus roseus]
MNMDITHPVRVVLFCDSEHARDAFGPYFTGATKKTWTFTQMVTHDQLVRKSFEHRRMDPNQWRNTRLVQAIQNKHQNMTSKFISKLTLHLVTNDLEIPVSNVIQEIQILLQTGCTYKRAWSAPKFAVERVFGIVRKLELAGTEDKRLKFERAMNEIKSRNVEAYNYLVKIPLQKWTLLHDGGHKHGVMTSNIS